MKYKTEIRCHLAIFGDNFNSEEFYKKIDIHPSKYWHKGDSIEGSKMIKKETGWDFSTPSVTTLFFSDVQKIIISNFKDKIHIIKKYTQKTGIYVKLYVVLEIWDDETPSMHFDKEFMDFLHQINASVSFDIYAYQNDKE